MMIIRKLEEKIDWLAQIEAEIQQLKGKWRRMKEEEDEGTNERTNEGTIEQTNRLIYQREFSSFSHMLEIHF